MKLGCLLLVSLIQVCHGSTEAPCEAGFSEQRYAFTVTRKVLERGRVLGKVTFDPCSSGPRALYSPDDTRFRVFPDGKVTVKRQVTLHDGSVSFVLNAWDGAGKKYSVTVLVRNEREENTAENPDEKIKSGISIFLVKILGSFLDKKPQSLVQTLGELGKEARPAVLLLVLAEKTERVDEALRFLQDKQMF